MERRERRSWWWRRAVDDFDQHLEYLKINYVLIIVRRCVFILPSIYTHYTTPPADQKRSFTCDERRTERKWIWKNIIRAFPRAGPGEASEMTQSLILSAGLLFTSRSSCSVCELAEHHRRRSHPATSQWRNEAQFCSSNLIIIFIFIFHSYIYILLGIVALLWDSLLCVSWAAARRFIVIISAKHSFQFQLFSLASADTFCMCFYMKSH